MSNLICKILILVLNILINDVLRANTARTEVKIDFNKTKVITQHCLNNVFQSLDLDSHIMRKPKLRLLVIMQNNLNSVVHYKWKVHSELRNIARMENIDVTQQIYEYVETAINNIKMENQNNSKIEYNKKNTEEMSDFMRDLINQINNQNITFENMYNLTNDRTETEDIRRMNGDIQIWEPNEEDFGNNTRRFGGRAVEIGQYPFIVSVHVLGKFTGTGCIISKNYIITSASSLQPSTQYKADQSPIQIRIGSEHTRTGGDILPSLEVIFHPRYDSVSLENNLALLKVRSIMHSLRRPAIKKIRIGSLPEKLPRNFANKGVFILGWGEMQEEAQKNNQLTSAFLDIISWADCIDIFTRNYVTERHFCAGLVYKGTSACNGDIGSPAIVLGTLVGLVSFDPPSCGTASSPTVFTKLAPYTSWINDVLNEDSQKIRYKSESIFAFEEAINDPSKTENEYEEILILRQLVHDLENPNNNLTQIIEEDQDIDDEMKIIFQTTTAVDLAHHSLVNKSIVLVPGLHIPSVSPEKHTITPHVTVSTLDIGLPDDIPYDIIDQLVHNSDELRYYVHDILTKGTFFKTNDRNLSKQRGNAMNKSAENDNFEYESDDGLSIEAPKFNKGVNLEERPKYQINSYSQSQEDVPVNLDRFRHNLQADVRADKKPKIPKDVWSEVLRIKQLHKKEMELNQYKGLGTSNSSKRFPSIYVPIPKKMP